MKNSFVILLTCFICANHTYAQDDKGKNDPEFNKKLICPFEKGTGREPKEAFSWDLPDMKIILISRTDSLVRSCIDAKVSIIQPGEEGQYELVIYYKNYYFWYSGITRALVKINQSVKAGEALGTYIKGQELEFRMFKDEEPMDPRKYLQCTMLNDKQNN